MTADPLPAAASRRATLNARVEKIFDHASDTRSLFLSLTSGRHLRFIPGQFISISIPLGDETRSRPYSIASDPEDRGPFEVCFNRVANGRGVAWMFERRVGDTIDFSGPFGAFTIERALEVEAGFIAEGTAIAPIRPMLKRALASSPREGARPKIHLIYAAPDREHILYSTELAGARADRAEFFVRDRDRACRKNLRSSVRVGTGSMGHRRGRSHAAVLYLRRRQGRDPIARPASWRRLRAPRRALRAVVTSQPLPRQAPDATMRTWKAE